MSKFTCSILAAALSLSAYSVSAATTTTNTEDASAMGTSATPQIVQQSKTTDSVPSHKRMSHKSRMHKCDAKIKMMDTNGDGMISKEEYMAYHEQMFDKMKQTNGMVNMKDMHMHGSMHSDR